MKRISKWKLILLILVLIFGILQFFQPERNLGGNSDLAISKEFPISPEVDYLLKTACYDCHSNTTNYPWYAKIQPVAWWMNEHVEDGKKHLNFDSFLSYRKYKQFHKMEEIDEMVAVNEMPLNSYLWMHSKAKLDENQKDLIIGWSKALRDSMRLRYSEEDLRPPLRK